MIDLTRPLSCVSVTAIVIFQVAALFCRSVLDLSLQRRGVAPAVANDLSYLVVPPILFVLMLPYLYRCRDALHRLFEPRYLTLRVVVCSVALGLTLRLLWWASTVFLVGIGIFRPGDANRFAAPLIGFDCPPAPVLVLSLVVVSGFVPLTEEVIYRGFVLHRFLRFGRATAVGVSAAIFSLMHVVDSYVATFVAGLVFAVQALNYRALWGPLIAHATYNFATIVDWNCFNVVWRPPTGDPLLEKLTWASVPVMLAGAWIARLLVHEKAAGARSSATLPRSYR